MKKIMIMVPVYSKQMQYTDKDEKNFNSSTTAWQMPGMLSP